MSATSIAAQLQIVKSLAKVDTDVPKRPITRPSVLFESKEAADLDIDTILTIALYGFEALLNIDERFKNHKNDLFSHKSREVDRELMSIEENNRINASIATYLRLLSGHLQSPSAFKTLEYLIRRYKIHLYNIEELILCSLPYHDTHKFVQIVQLIDFGNSRWKFLDGVKVSGAPPPREVIVQQCTRDVGLLEVICNYASPAKKHQYSTPVISFCTAVVVEVLGSMGTVDSEIVKRILPFLNSGLQSGSKGSSDYKAGTLMIVGLLAKKVSLSPKLVSSLIRSVSELARIDAQESEDSQWVQLSIMALINIVQFQSVKVLPKKAVDSLKEIKHLHVVLSQLTTRFNIDIFLALLLKSLIDCSNSDEQCKLALVSIIESVAIGESLLHDTVFRLLSACLKLSENTNASELSDIGSWAKQILLILNKKYLNELRAAVHDFLEDKKVQLKDEKSVIEALSKVLDGNSGSSVDFADSRLWFALDHPKAEIRRAALSNIDLSTMLDGGVTSQRLLTIQDAVVRCLCDDDLSVVQAALSLDRLPEFVNFGNLLEKVQNLLHKCTQMLWLEAPKDQTLARDVAVSCLKHATSVLRDQSDAAEGIATMLLPLLLVFPKTELVNLKALELAKGFNWPFYKDLVSASDLKKEIKMKVGKERLYEVNVTIVRSLVGVFSANANKFMPWLIKCCNGSELSKTLVFLVSLQTFGMEMNAFCECPASYDAFFAFLMMEWRALEDAANTFSGQEFDIGVLDSANMELLLKDFDINNIKGLNARIMVLIFWRSIKAYISIMPTIPALDDDGKGMRMLWDLYIFFSESTQKLIFKEHRHYLVQNCKTSPTEFLSRFITEQGVSSTVQVESLHSFALLCSHADEASAFQLLAGFPLILVPLSSEFQVVRTAAMKYVEELSNLCTRAKCTEKKNGNSESWSSFIDELLNLLVQQNKLILSDRNFLPSFMASILSSSFKSLLVLQNVGKKFEKSSIDRILTYILGSATKFPGYAKLKILSLLKELGGAIFQIKDVECLLCELLQRRHAYHVTHDKSYKELTSIDVDILCLLIEMSSMPMSYDVRVLEKHLLPSLWIEGMLSDDAAIIRPCIAFLQKLNDNIYKSLSAEMQINLFRQLVMFHHDANTDVQTSTRDALSRLNISCSTVSHMLDDVLAFDPAGSTPQKKKKTMNRKPDIFLGGGNVFSFLSSFLDVLLIKKDIENRALLVEPIFQLLRKAFSHEWASDASQEEWAQASSGVSQTISNTLCCIQQTLLLILEDIIASLLSCDVLPSGVFDKLDASLLVACARSAKDVTTRNHVYSLFAAIAKVEGDKIFPQIPEIIAVIGENAISHSDSHSGRVFEDFISTVVPCWLSKTDGSERLLQIFINVMPDVAPHRRLSIVLHLLKTLGESSSLGSLLALLFRSLVSKDKYSSLSDGITSGFISSVTQSEWGYNFASQLCEQYTCMIWLPSLVSLLKQLQKEDQNREVFMALLFSLKFILEKLQDPEFVFKLQSIEGTETVQGTLCELMVQVISCWQLIDLSEKKKSAQTGLKKELREHIHSVLMKITKRMLPSAFFQGIIKLLGQQGKVTRKKALQVLCETVRDIDILRSKREKGSNIYLRNSWQLLKGSDFDSFVALCQEILQLLKGSSHNGINGSVRLAAISTLEVLANKFSSNHMVFSECLACVVENVLSDDLAVGSSCLRTAGALINVLGPRALSELPNIMKSILKRIQDVFQSSEYTEENTRRPTSKDSVMLSILVTLEALVNNLGSFLNPYLNDIIELMVLHPEYLSESNPKLKCKGDGVRKHLSEKVPIRLALPAIQNVYPKAAKSGDLCLSSVFELLKNFIGDMDRPSVSGYHANIFDLCMTGLDLRSQCLASIMNISFVEKHIISAMIALTMKMTETMFRPLFIRSIEWAESNLEEDGLNGKKNIGRAVSFYGLVSNLAESHRSLFVPYFKYLLEGSIRYLADDDGKSDGLSRKKKKVKLQKSENGQVSASDASSLEKWHLRALILSSLHKCFLYDTGSLKFLDSSKFQLLLKPIVSQLVVEPPTLLEEHPTIPSVKEVDDILVACVGQMAVTAGSDLLWKPLNYEVLMQTRSEMVRSRILGLRVVKYLVDNLKEEYLVLLAETIPFLAELLEDVELPVKTLAQDILKELESMSGENLRDYF